MPRLVAKMTMGDRLDSRALFRKVKHSMSSMCTSSRKRTPGISSATPCSMYLFTTCSHPNPLVHLSLEGADAVL